MMTISAYRRIMTPYPLSANMKVIQGDEVSLKAIAQSLVDCTSFKLYSSNN